MPRPLVYGNGSFLIAFDQRHQGRDLFWPQVGYPNHLLGHLLRVALWDGEGLSWCDSDVWERSAAYEPASLVGDSVWRSWKSGVEVRVREAVDPESPVFVRTFAVQDLRGLNRSFQLFFTQNFILGQSDVGNTAFYNPFCDAILHYRGPYYALVSACSESGGICQYATGLKGFADLEGTWKDAEDGALSGNPIAQGAVDSTFAVDVRHGQEATFVLAMGDRLDRVVETFEKAREAGFSDVFGRSSRACGSWLQDARLPDTGSLPQAVRDVFLQSLLLIQTQVDRDGSVVAANDADILLTNRATYSYCWPRDGACVSRSLARVGDRSVADRFIAFCERAMPHDRPYFLQKYRSDGSLGASWHPWIVDGKPEVPFQEDETALVLDCMAWACSPEVGEKAWLSYGRRAAEFVLAHRDADGLPLPSWDLWEERHGVHFFTACAVVAALRAAERLAEGCGERGAPYKDAAAQTQAALSRAFFDQKVGRYVRMLGPKGADKTPDSAVVGGLLLVPELLQGNKRAHQTVSLLESELEVKTPVGGLARYDGDYYFRKVDDQPGNPWVISTMWLSRALSQTGDKEPAVKRLSWAAGRAEPTGVLAEQYHPETGEPLSVSPLTWSHAEFVEAVLDAVGGVG